MNPFRTGKLVLFQVTYDRDWHFFEIIFFIIIGIFGVRTLVLYCTTRLTVPPGTLWSVCDQVQPPSRRIPKKISRWLWRNRGCGLSHYHSDHQLLQQVFAN